MKKAFIAGFLFLSILFVSTPNAGAATIEELQAQINALMAQLTALQAQQGTTSASPTTTSTDKFCYTFIKNLKFGDGKTSYDEPMVRALQTALEKEGFVISLDEKKAGSVFGKSTEAAVIGFQEKYAEEILAPNGLTSGNGFVGAATRVKLNALYGCSVPTIKIPADTLLTPLTPVGGEIYKQGTSFNIRWTGGSQSQDIYLFDNRKNGTNQTIYLGSVTKTEKDVQSFYWTVPNDLATGFGYQIQFGSHYKVNASGFSGAFGVVSSDTSITPPPTPIISSFTANPGSISLGQMTTLTYVFSNATWCGIHIDKLEIPGSGIGVKNSVSIDTYPANTTTYTVNCYNEGPGYTEAAAPKASKNVTVYVSGPTSPVPTPTIGTPAPTVYLNNASDQKNAVAVTSGSSVNFVWGATNFTKCQMFKNGTLFNDGVYNSYGVNVLSYTGTFYVPNQTQNATYTLTCTGAGGSQSGSVAVSILGQTSGSTPAPTTTYGDDPYSANYSQTSTIPLSGTEKTVTYTYPSNPCGSLMTSYTSPGSVYVGNGPVFTSASAVCAPNTPNINTFRVYSCSNNTSLQGQATFAFQCNAVTSSLNMAQPNYASVFESLRGLLQQLSGQLGN